MLKDVVNLPFRFLGKAARAVQEREKARLAAQDLGPGARSANVGPRRSPLDVPEDFRPKPIELDATDLRAELDAGRDIPVVDVRPPEAWDRGRIPGAIHMPGDAILMGLAEIPSDGRIVVCGDRAGRHARRVTLFLRYRGLDDSWLVDGGFPAWKDLGADVETH